MRIKLSYWSLLIFPPFFFLICLLAAITFLSVSNVPENKIPESMEKGIPYILLASQILMLLLLLLYAKKHEINLIQDTTRSRHKMKDIIWGSALGIAIAVIYFKFGLIEIIEYLQSSLGDYVPPGETSTSLGSNPIPFFIANILLAPFVEEHIYRNTAFKKLRETKSNFTAVLISSLLFGLLHWMGGFWYIIATTILIGIPFGIIQLKRNGILLVFCAHLALNLTEFLFLY